MAALEPLCYTSRDGRNSADDKAGARRHEGMMNDALLRAVDNTIRFLRMAAIELRRIAETAPDIADQLRHIADQLDADANDLERAAGPNRS